MGHKKHHEEHEEHVDESWLVPYADILTLLLALFIVLFAASQVDQEKFQSMANAFQAAFDAGGGGAGLLDQGTAPIPMFVAPQPKSQERLKAEAEETKQLEYLEARLDKYISDNALSDRLNTNLTGEGLVLEFQDSFLFQSGSADMMTAAEPVARVVARVLGAIDQNVVISGHTDNIPINTQRFQSNWDLSAQRALNFMKYLLASNPDLKPERFSAIGYSEYRPIATNLTEAGRAQNRRVEILIVRQYQLDS